MSARVTPYQGLVPYDEQDAAFFFGRDLEIELITANLAARRFTLLYGPSGVGKSSVLRAGVAHQLRQRARENFAENGAPEFAAVVFSSWRDDPIAGLIARVEDEVTRTLSPAHLFTSSLLQTKTEPPQATLQLADALKRASARVQGDLLIILDQFEEYFLYHGAEDGDGTFAAELPRLLTTPEARVHVLVSIREDALAKLDRFEGRIPNLFKNFLRVEHLGRDAAREAIEKPLARYNQWVTAGDAQNAGVVPNGLVSIEPALVAAVLEQVKTGQVILGEAGQGVVEQETDEARIETPYLQLVMTRLWDEEQRADSHTLRLETLERLGGAEKIVRTHLDTTMSSLTPQEQEVSANIFNFLVTPSGTKIAHTARDLADYSHVPQNEIAATLEKLSGGDIRILRPVAPPLDQPTEPRYEIFHDVLGAPILDWRTRFVQGQEKIAGEKKLAAEKRRVRRLRFGLVGLSLLLLAVIALAIFAFTQQQAAQRASAEAETQRQEAERQKSDALAQKELADQERKNAEASKAQAVEQQKIARSGELAALSLGQLESDPERALLIAREAMNTAQTAQAEDALRATLLDPYRLTLKGKGNAITDARITPDGKYVATLEPSPSSCGFITAKCGSVRIWDAQSGALVSELQMPQAARGIDMSADGKYLVTANDDAVARVWEIPSGKLVSELRGHEKKINDVNFSPDGKQVVTASDDKSARVWDALTGKQIHELGHDAKVIYVAFSPNGKYLGTGTYIGGATTPDFSTLGDLYIWDAATGQSVSKISYSPEGIFFSPDSQFVASFGNPAALRVASTASGTLIIPPDLSKTLVSSIAYSTDGKFIAEGKGDGTLRIVDALTGQEIASLRTNQAIITSLSFDPQGKQIVSTGADGVARVWNLTPPSPINKQVLFLTNELHGHTGIINRAQFSSDGQSILTASDDGTARLWHVNAGQALIGHTKFVQKTAYSPDGKTVATASSDGTTRLWDTSTRETRFTLPAPTDAGRALMFSKDGKRLLTVNDNGRIQVWNVETGERLWEFYDQAFQIFRAALTPDSERVITFGLDDKLRVWNAATGEKIAERRLHGSDIFDYLQTQNTFFALNPDGTEGIVSVLGYQIRRFDQHTGEALKNLNGAHLEGSVAFSTDGRHLAVTYSDGITSAGISREEGGIRVWDMETLQVIYDVRGRNASNIMYSPDGKYLLTMYPDKSVRVWDANIGKLLQELKGQNGEINRATFSPDGRFILTASNDNTARLWETATGKLVETLYGHSDILTDIAFSPDGKTILTAGDKTARLYECVACASPQDLMQLANARVTRELTCEERVTFLHQELECANP